MKRVWSVTLTIVEDWGGFAAIASRHYEILATSEMEAELLITAYLVREYKCAVPETKFNIRDVIISPMLCDMNAIRDGLVPPVRCLD